MQIIGLPLSVASITPEFENAVSGEGILVSASYINPRSPQSNPDFNCARAGFERLMELGYAFLHFTEFNLLNRHDDVPDRCVISVNAWMDETGRRYPADVAAANVTRFIAELRQATTKNIGYICQGSPLLYDGIVKSLILHGNCTIVDTASSADLCYAAVAAECKLPRHTVRSSLYESLLAGHANVIGCIGTTYGNGRPLPFVAQLPSVNRVWLVKIGETTRVEKVSGAHLLTMIQNRDSELNHLTAIIEVS